MFPIDFRPQHYCENSEISVWLQFSFNSKISHQMFARPNKDKINAQKKHN